MRSPASSMLVGLKRWAGLRHEAGTRAGPEGGVERGRWHGVRNERDAWGADAAGGLARLLRGSILFLTDQREATHCDRP